MKGGRLGLKDIERKTGLVLMDNLVSDSDQRFYTKKIRFTLALFVQKRPMSFSMKRTDIFRESMLKGFVLFGIGSRNGKRMLFQPVVYGDESLD